MLTRRLNRNERANDAFNSNCDGPLIELRPAFPHCPGAGATNAAELTCRPSTSTLIGSPVASGLRLPVTPVPCTGVSRTGDSGVPLPTVSCAVIVHCANSFSFQLFENRPPRARNPERSEERRVGKECRSGEERYV